MLTKVLIIGAGPAGLTAAEELLESPEQFDVTVLEATSVIGGIACTIEHAGNRIDMGGHRFFSKVERVNKWWLDRLPLQGEPSLDDLLLGRQGELSPGGPDPQAEDMVMLRRSRVSRILYNGHFFDYPLKANFATFSQMGLLNTIRAVASYLFSVIRKREENSLEDFYINRFGRVLYSMFFEGYTAKLWGRHPSEISASWGAQRVKGLSVFALVKDMLRKLFFSQEKTPSKVETSLIDAFMYPKLGPGQLWEESAKRIVRAGGKVLLNHKVKKLVVENGEARRVICTTPNGNAFFDADIVISSMPIKDLVGSMTGDSLPVRISDAARDLPYRDFVTVGLLLDKLKLVNNTKIKTLGGIVPDCWIYIQNSNVSLGRLQIFNNWSPYMVKDPINTVWIGLEYFCSEGDLFWNSCDEDIIELAKRELEITGIANSVNVRDSHCARVRKAYPAYFDTYDDIDSVRDFLLSINNLYCVGRNGQHRYNNMDHSMLTSFLTADLLKGGSFVSRMDIWNVNTEEEYHESGNGK